MVLMVFMPKLGLVTTELMIPLSTVENERRPQCFGKMEDNLNFIGKMEDNANVKGNGRQPQFL
jgi:hypothetical protein